MTNYLKANIENAIQLLPVWILLSSFTFSFYPEGANVGSIPLVVGCGPGQLEQHVTDDVAFPNMPTGRVPSELEIYRGMTSSKDKLCRLSIH